MTSLEIVPTIIPESLEDICFYMKQVVGVVPIVQIDVMDGKYVAHTTWPYTKSGAVEFEGIVAEKEGFPFWDELDFEVDMLVQNSPEEVIRWVHAGASRVIIHIESTEDIGGCIEAAKSLGGEVALALKPSTPTEELERWLGEIVAVQFMGNDNLGQHGVGLDKGVLEKIRKFKESNKKYPDVTIAIDIGVSNETILELREVGVTRFASGSEVFDEVDVRHSINELINCAK